MQNIMQINHTLIIIEISLNISINLTLVPILIVCIVGIQIQ